VGVGVVGSDAGSAPGSSDAGAGVNPGVDAWASDQADGGLDAPSVSPDARSDAASCTSGPSSTAGQPGYVGDWRAGDYPPDFVDGGSYLTITGVPGQMNNTRQYAVHVPAGYQADTPVPALFCIHGLGQTASLFCLDTGVAWPDKGDKEGFVVIMPNGYQNSWNGGTCCGAAASNGLDDVALVRAIFAEVGKHVNIDLGRVYATGLSNGAYLSYRLACQASDLFVAIAPSAGAVGTAAIGGGTQTTSDLATCAPTHAVSVLDIHGTSDPLIPYSTQKPSLAYFQAKDGCSTATGAAAAPGSGGDTTCVAFTGCPTCPAAQATACTIQGGGHCWFGSSDCGTGGGAIGTAIVGNNSNFMKNTDAIWSFFAPLSR
jgi:polyhydroxybutyrate depolymerase